VAIGLVGIIGNSIDGYWCLFYWWLFLVILGYFTFGHYIFLF
jgi:hypothetical protein